MGTSKDMGTLVGALGFVGHLVSPRVCQFRDKLAEPVASRSGAS